MSQRDVKTVNSVADAYRSMYAQPIEINEDILNEELIDSLIEEVREEELNEVNLTTNMLQKDFANVWASKNSKLYRVLDTWVRMHGFVDNAKAYKKNPKDFIDRLKTVASNPEKYKKQYGNNFPQYINKPNKNQSFSESVELTEAMSKQMTVQQYANAVGFDAKEKQWIIDNEADIVVYAPNDRFKGTNNSWNALSYPIRTGDYYFAFLTGKSTDDQSKGRTAASRANMMMNNYLKSEYAKAQKLKFDDEPYNEDMIASHLWNFMYKEFNKLPREMGANDTMTREELYKAIHDTTGGGEVVFESYDYEGESIEEGMLSGIFGKIINKIRSARKKVGKKIKLGKKAKIQLKAGSPLKAGYKESIEESKTSASITRSVADAYTQMQQVSEISEMNGMSGRKIKLTYRPQRANSNKYDGKKLSSHSTIEKSDLYLDLVKNSWDIADDCNSIAIRVPRATASEKDREKWLDLVKSASIPTSLIRGGGLSPSEVKELYNDMKNAVKAFGGKVLAQSHEVSVNNYNGKLNIDKGLNAMLKAIDEFGMRNHVSVSSKDGVLTRIQDAGRYMKESVEQLDEVKRQEVDAMKKLSKDMQSVLKGYQKIMGMGDKELKNTVHNKNYKAILDARNKVLTLIGTLNTKMLMQKENFEVVQEGAEEMIDKLFNLKGNRIAGLGVAMLLNMTDVKVIKAMQKQNPQGFMKTVNAMGKETGKIKPAQEKEVLKMFKKAGIKPLPEALDNNDKPKVKEIIKKLKGASKAHAGQAKDLEKAVSEKVKDGKLDPLSKMGKSKLTGSEVQTYYKDNPKQKMAAKDKSVKKAIELALDLSGNMNYAMKEIEKIKRGLSRLPAVKLALRHANESNEWTGHHVVLENLSPRDMIKLKAYGSQLAKITKLPFDDSNPEKSIDKLMGQIWNQKHSPSNWDRLHKMVGLLKSIGVKMPSLKGKYMGYDPVAKKSLFYKEGTDDIVNWYDKIDEIKEDVEELVEKPNKELPVADVKKIAQLTNRNDHNGSLLHLAKKLGMKAHIDGLKHIIGLHKALGHMPQGLIDIRKKISDSLMRTSKAYYSNHDDIYKSF